VVSNDTGPAHIARAVGAPLVAIYWVGNLINAGPLTRRRTRPLVAWQTRCSECGADNTRARCPHDHTFVGEIAVDDVLGAAAEIGAGVRQAVAAA
jgi:ADP-heptose:LPS heptosyltransferase